MDAAPRRPVREAAAVLVALALAGVGLRVWETAQSGYQSLTHAAPSRTDREVGNALGGNLNGALLASRRVIPRNATFSIRVGLTPPVDGSILDAIPGLFRYWLLPRRYNDDAHAVRWVITFHHPAETLGVPVRKVIPLGPGVNVVEVAR